MSDTGILISLDDQEITRSKIVLDYTNRDFVAIRSQLIGLARGLMPEWETAGEPSDFGTLLLELFSFMGDALHFYIDRTASEAFLGTAIRRQSVLYIADMLGYTPIGQQSASVNLTWALDTNAEAAVTIPKGTRVHSEASSADDLVVFELDHDVFLEPGDGITIGQPTQVGRNVGFATEGLTVKDKLIGQSYGAPNTEMVIPDHGVIAGTVGIISREGSVTVPWTFVSDISLARPTQSVFTTFIDDQEQTHVIFGDNAVGRIPPVQAQIYATYRFGRGIKANAVPAGKINTIIANTVGEIDLSYVTVENKSSPVGGTDPESVDAMRYSIPRAASRIKSRAVTLNDYADLALQVPGVSKSVAHGTVYTAVHIKIAPVDGQADANYMTRLCNQVEEYMADKVMIGSSVYAEPENVADLWENIYIRVTVHVVAGYNRTSVRNQVDAAIRAMLAFNVVDFGFKVTIGGVYRAALAVQGVEWAEVTWLSSDGPAQEQAGGGAPNHSEEIALDFDDDVRWVKDVYTDELRIPKIDTTIKNSAGQLDEPEAETDFDLPEYNPALSEAERTHDGLWVKAFGGMTNT